MLEALERGEMKFESNGCVLSCSEDEDEDEEVDPLSIELPVTTSVGTVKVGVDEFLSQVMKGFRGITSKCCFFACDSDLNKTTDSGGKQGNACVIRGWGKLINFVRSGLKWEGNCMGA